MLLFQFKNYGFNAHRASCHIEVLPQQQQQQPQRKKREAHNVSLLHEVVVFAPISVTAARLLVLELPFSISSSFPYTKPSHRKSGPARTFVDLSYH
jgi:hypothetical protein